MIQSLHIRFLSSPDELKQMAELERMVWNAHPIPFHQTFTAAKNGGILLGAYDGSKLAGFLYSFPGFLDGNAYLCSHMLGIHPSYRKSGMGERLKQRQKEIAVEMGYKLITWTFDPLESVNAYLNLHKLRGIGAHYYVNHYGTMSDALNEGLDSDRFLVEWWIDHRYTDEAAPEVVFKEDNSLLKIKLNERNQPYVYDYCNNHIVESSQNIWFVPIPDSFQEIKKADISLAIDWRQHTRMIFCQLLTKGYVAVDLIRNKEQGMSYYIFHKRNERSLPSWEKGRRT